MKNMNVYKVIQRIPENANIISSRWIFKYKRDSNGNIAKRKARLVARGFTQIYGIDYKDTFSPTLKHDSIRIITAIAVRKNFIIKQININSAYLNAKLNENIYMNILEGHPLFVKRYFWKLKKALYGLKQSDKEWNNKLNEELLKINFTKLKSDPCIYVKFNMNNNIECMLAVYVDDILIAGIPSEVEKTKGMIKNKYNIKNNY